MNKAIKCGKLFNSIDGSVSENQVVLVEGERIKEVVDAQAFCAEGYEVIDLGKLGMAHGTPEKEVAEVVKDADAVIAGLEPYTEGVLSVCPKLKLISRRGIGYDSVDVGPVAAMA